MGFWGWGLGDQGVSKGTRRPGSVLGVLMRNLGLELGLGLWLGLGE